MAANGITASFVKASGFANGACNLIGTRGIVVTFSYSTCGVKEAEALWQ